MIRPPPRSTLERSAAASDVYKRQVGDRHNPRDELPCEIVPAGGADPETVRAEVAGRIRTGLRFNTEVVVVEAVTNNAELALSLIHISEPTRPY